MPVTDPVTATFRFYAQLATFLAPDKRGRSFESRCAENATTKHMIEALGVPHTEVELLLVNGEPARLDRILRDGDRVAVYPKFESIGLGPLLRAQALPPDPLRFVADAHLGGLARLLRMAGFDTLYDNHVEDGAIEAIALREGRIVLTRDRELLKRRGVRSGCYVHAIKAAQQFREVAGRLDLAQRMQPFSLCLACNAPLRAIDKALVYERIPPAVQAWQTQFQTCDVCHGVFWKGSHWKRMCELLQDIG
jgi:uncharacterized protein with PIN domain/sulfur carrier protein ThiS